jgi:15-cis-phytoene synthase
MSRDLELAYEYCRDVTRSEARNFYFGFILLPPRRRLAIYAAYAFARQCDDIVDSGVETEEARRRLCDFRAALDRCLAGEPDGLVFTALADAVGRFDVPVEALYEVIAGVEMDLTVRRYETFKELLHYSSLVASSVGLISIAIFGHTGGAQARKHAADLGVALQLTNILRDVKEDADRGRIYIPLEDIAAFGSSEREILEGVVSPEFRRLVAFEVRRAEVYYESGRHLLPYLPRRARACVSVMAAIYRGVLRRVEQDPGAVFRRRIGVSTRTKLALASRELVRSLSP